MKKSIIIGIMILIAVIALAFIAFTGFAVKQSESDTIKLGSIGILTGDSGGAAWGIAAKNGIDLAVLDINSRGGVNGKLLSVVHEDDSGDVKKTLSAFQKLTDVDNINIIIGPTWSNLGIPLVNSADKNKIVMISPSLGLKDFNEGGKYLFNTWPHDEVLSTNLADYVYSKGYKKVAIISANHVWVIDQTNAFKKRFEELGGKVLVVTNPNPEDKNVDSDALKIKNNPDVEAIVSTASTVASGTQTVIKARELGVNWPIFSLSMDSQAIKSGNGAYEQMIYLTSLTPTPEFKKRYEETYNQPINIGADSAYDAVMMIARAINATKSTDTSVLADYLGKIKEYDGVSGHLVSDGKRGFTKNYSVMKVEDGNSVLLG